jgi:hypothetical protein
MPDEPKRRSVDRMTFTAILALLLTVGFFAFLACMMFVTIPEGNSEMLFTAAGVLFGGATMAWGFYLGSSESSKVKDATIATAVANAEGNPSGMSAKP